VSFLSVLGARCTRGFSGDMGGRHETVDGHPRNLGLDQAFDVFQVLQFLAVHQRDRGAAAARAPRTADAVHVIFRHVRQFEIHHMRQHVDVQTPRGNVGRNQHRHRSILELRKRLGTSRLALVAVNRGGGNAVGIQFFSQAVRAMFGAGEHQHLFPVIVFDQVGEQMAFEFLRNHMHALRDQFRGGVATRHFDKARIVQQPVGKCLDLL